MISKDLATEILGYKVTQEPQKYGNEISFHYMFTKDTELHQSINIHELAYKCKEWAYKQEYSLSSGHRFEANEWFCDYETSEEYSIRAEEYYSNIDAEYKMANTEPEAIFKACEWILEDIDDK